MELERYQRRKRTKLKRSSASGISVVACVFIVVRNSNDDADDLILELYWILPLENSLTK